LKKKLGITRRHGETEAQRGEWREKTHAEARREGRRIARFATVAT